ncbi:MAG: ABC transporter ATP-binding protein [Candidatus Cloacimonetes bacterium]|nr:ABC transporter ATP-binding protein [Candidatus Cloacimonadota bacterium]
MYDEPVIKLKDIRMNYGTEDVLKGINLEIKPAQIIGYIGPNGAGKTTTIKILLGMINNYKGEIEIFGEKITPDQIDYKKKIGYVPEGGDIYENLTGWEYLEFIGEIYEVPSAELKLRSETLADCFGMTLAFNDRISSYSKGMKQKILIISALLNNPEIIILDEPLTGLDANSVMIFKNILIKLAKEGKTIFYSSHLMDVVEKITDRIIIIANGEILADGTFNELKQKSKEGTLEKIFNDLTGFHEQEQIADRVIAALRD